MTPHYPQFSKVLLKLMSIYVFLFPGQHQYKTDTKALGFTQILREENKEMFNEIAIFPLIQRIKEIYKDAYFKAKGDKDEFLDTGNFDLTTLEFIAENFYLIKANFREAEKIIFNNPTLSKIKVQYSNELGEIQEYLREVQKWIDSVELDTDEDYFTHLKDKNYDRNSI